MGNKFSLDVPAFLFMFKNTQVWTGNVRVKRLLISIKNKLLSVSLTHQSCINLYKNRNGRTFAGKCLESTTYGASNVLEVWYALVRLVRSKNSVRAYLLHSVGLFKNAGNGSAYSLRPTIFNCSSNVIQCITRFARVVACSRTASGTG